MTENYKNHWNLAYDDRATEDLGWYEESSTKTIALIEKTGLPKDAKVLNVGIGSSRLIDELLTKNYTNLIASDLSNKSLEKLKNRIGKQSENVQFIVDDLINATKLNQLKEVDLWNDRAVLHFFTKSSDQKKYFDLLKKVVKSNGFVILAEFALNGAEKCCNLDVFRYSKEMLQERLGDDFVLKDSFKYTFINPRGGERPYIYTLFQRK